METEINTTHTFDFSNRLYKISIIFVAVLAIAAAGWIFSQFAALPQNAPHEITVSGIGKAYMKPDIAVVNFGVINQSLKSQDAVNQNNAKMNAVIDAIKSLGVADKDIQTTLYNLTPWYDYTLKGSIFKGYQLNQQILVKIRNFDKISDILDKATSQGATNIGDLQFKIDDPGKIQSEARATAIAKAKEKLADIVNQSGLKIGKLVNISEGYFPTEPPFYAQGTSSMKESVNVAPQIQSGQQEVDLTVTLTYQVK